MPKRRIGMSSCRYEEPFDVTLGFAFRLASLGYKPNEETARLLGLNLQDTRELWRTMFSMSNVVIANTALRCLEFLDKEGDE